MSRFANPLATRTVDLGPCECPGGPHGNDWVEIRTDLSGPELADLMALQGKGQWQQAEAVSVAVARWNLLTDDGQEIDPSPAALFGLKQDTLSLIGEAIGDVVAENLHLPNRRSAPSRASSRGSASPTPIRRQATGT